jgi:hypothetical protein
VDNTFNAGTNANNTTDSLKINSLEEGGISLVGSTSLEDRMVGVLELTSMEKPLMLQKYQELKVEPFV